MINLKELRIGDVIGTTSGTPLAMLIKTRTWGWRSMLSQSKSSHIAVVVDRGHGLLYFAEMLPKGIALTEIHTYNNPAPCAHIAWAGRHEALDNDSVAVKFNNTILALHAKRVKYGYDDLFDYMAELVGANIKDKPQTLICSELPRVAFKAAGIATPPAWDKKCSPKDWQCWPEMYNITPAVIG